VEWLLANAEVDARWCLVHATHAADAELEGVARSGAVVGLCPVTEANLGDGVFPATQFVELEGAYGVGSDSNVLIDAAEELRLLEYGQRLSLQQRAVLDIDTLYRQARAGGARALARPAEELKAGAPASLISLDAGHASLAGAPPDEILSRWIFAAGRTAVDCVWRRGRKLVERGRHLRRGTILERYRNALESLP
jgi:formiminoglutamate deiminase